jgi:hypothetical protein
MQRVQENHHGGESASEVTQKRFVKDLINEILNYSSLPSQYNEILLKIAGRRD